MSRSFYGLLILVSLAAGFSLWYATPAGIGLTNDSAAYIGGARSLLAGTGYSDIWLDSTLEAITHYPPLLSLTLSGLGLLSLDPLRGARLLNILLFGANTALMGIIGWRITRSQSAGILLALLFGLNAHLLRIHAYALSEPLYIFFSLLSFLSFDFWISRYKSQGTARISYWLVLTGILTGFAFLTRYSGLALIATFLLSIFLLTRTFWFKNLTLFLAGAIPPIAAWFIRNKLVAETVTNRSFQYHPIQGKNVEVGFYNISQFLMPIEAWQRGLMKSGAIPWLLSIVGLVLLVWLAIRAWRLIFGTTQSPNLLFFTNAIYIFGYLGAILFSMSFFDASTKFQHRILSPLYVSGIILFVAVLSTLITKSRQEAQKGKNVFWHTLHKNQTRRIFAFCLVLIAIGLSAYDFQLTTTALRDAAGLGYGSWKWRDSLVMEKLKELPANVAIYTNTPPAVYFVTGRASRVIPTVIDPVDNLPRGDYEQGLMSLRDDLLAGRAVLALFDTSGIEDALGAENVSLFIDGLVVMEKAQGDILYGKP